MVDALFAPDGDRFVPTALARGPWSPDALHGGPPAALLARCVERVEDGHDMMVTRLTVELLRPIPLGPLAVQTRMLRPGRKVQIVGASLHAGDVEVARVTALRIRTIELPVPAELRATDPPPGPDTGQSSFPPWNQRIDYEAFHNRGAEHRFVAGGFDRPGPAIDWIRLRVPLVAGEETSPLARVAAAADFGNGVSWTLPRGEDWRFINPDLTVALHRLPDGEWVCLEAVTFVESSGVGQAESVLWDERGRLGRAVQSLLLERPGTGRP
jgi:hypothetical protein